MFILTGSSMGILDVLIVIGCTFFSIFNQDLEQCKLHGLKYLSGCRNFQISKQDFGKVMCW